MIISTDEEDTNALTDAGMDATGDIIIITDKQDEIDNVEDYLCQEGEREEEQEEEDEEEGIYYISEQEDSSDWANRFYIELLTYYHLKILRIPVFECHQLQRRHYQSTQIEAVNVHIHKELKRKVTTLFVFNSISPEC